MVLVLMNMLLAMVMDHYMTLLVEARKDPTNSPTLWHQVIRQNARYWHCRGFITNKTLLSGLRDAKPPLHPEQVVTRDSLLAAWPGMKDKQVTFLLDVLQGAVDKA